MADAIRVPVPGLPSAEVLVRTPSAAELIAGNWLHLPIYGSLAEQESEDQPVWIRHDDTDDDQKARYDQWIALVCLAPKVTLDPADPAAIHVSELDGRTKRAIWQATYVPMLQSMDAAAHRFGRLFDDSRLVYAIDLTARRYGQRPSALVGLTDIAQAFDFDMAATVVALRHERALHAEAMADAGVH